jgi:hypothetical protein
VKVFAAIGLLFFVYCAVQVIAKWRYRNSIEKAIWLVVIVVGGWWCLSVLFG